MTALVVLFEFPFCKPSYPQTDEMAIYRLKTRRLFLFAALGTAQRGTSQIDPIYGQLACSVDLGQQDHRS